MIRLLAPTRLGHLRVQIVVATIGVLAIALLSVGIGSVSIPPETVVRILLTHLGFLAPTADRSSVFEAILLEIRLPRVALVGLTGAALASSGAVYQGIFRNPLADPYLMGVAAGASLGATSAIALQSAQPGIVGLLTVPLAAFVGGLITVWLVYTLGRVGPRVPTTTLLLAGVAINSIATSINIFLLLLLGQQSVQVLAFLLGGFSSAGWRAVWITLPFLAIGLAVMYLQARALNLLLFDEEQAQQLGVDVERVKLVIGISATLTTASAVAFSGLIGFVGLVVPHVARLLVGPDHRRLLPLATLIGAGFLMLADLVARSVIPPQELPLGIVTACAGAPFFLYLLRRAKNAAYF